MAANELLEGVSIREIQPEDVSLVQDFFDCMGKESRSVFNRRDYNQKGVLRFCAHPDPTRRYWMAELEEKMAGYVFFLDWNTSIPALGIAVRDEWQGMGLGKRLLLFALEMAKDEGKGGIQLTTHVANLRAQVLYESVGFSCMGSCKNGTELFYLFRYRE